MLAEKSYPTEYVERCRGWLRDRVAASAALDDQGQAELLVLGIDHLFTHRMRGQEGKGTLQRVRQLCDQIRQGSAPALTVAEAGELAESFCDEILERFPA